MTSSFQNVVGTPRDAVPDISKTNYLQTAPDMTEAVNKQIDDNIKDTKEFFDQMVKLEELAASKLDKRLAAIENIVGKVGSFAEKRRADEADGFGRIVVDLIEDQILAGSKEYTKSKNELDLNIATANSEIDKDPDLDQQTKLEYKFGTPTEEIFDRRVRDFIKERYGNKTAVVGDLLRSNGSLDSTTAQEHTEYERKALLSFYRNIGYDAKQLGYDPNDPRFIRQLIELTEKQVKSELKSQRESFKAAFRDKVQDEKNYTFNTRIIESVKGISIRDKKTGERLNDTFFEDGGIVHQIAIQDFDGNRQRATDLAFETVAELVKSGDILPNEARALYQDLPYTDPNGKEYKNYQEYVNKQREGTGFKARAQSRIQRLSNAITSVEKLAVDNENAARVIESNNFVNDQVIPRIAENKARGIDGLDEGQAGALINQFKQEPFYLEGVTPIPQILLSYLNRTQTGGSRDKNVGLADKYANEHNKTYDRIKKLVAEKEKSTGDTSTLGADDMDTVDRIYAAYLEEFRGENGQTQDLIDISISRGKKTFTDIRASILKGLMDNYESYTKTPEAFKASQLGVQDVIKLRRELNQKPELFKKPEAFKGEPVDDLFEFVKTNGDRHPELKDYYGTLRIRVPDGNGNFRILSGTEAIYDRAVTLKLQDPNTLLINPDAQVLKDWRKENDMKTFPSEQKALRNYFMSDQETADFNTWLTSFSKQQGGDENTYSFVRNSVPSNRSNLRRIDGNAVVNLAEKGSTEFGMYKIPGEIILALDKAGKIDKTKPFDENAQSKAVIDYMILNANRRSKAIRGAITKDNAMFGELINMSAEEQEAVNNVFPNLKKNYWARFENVDRDVAKIIITDIEKAVTEREKTRAEDKARLDELRRKRDKKALRSGRIKEDDTKVFGYGPGQTEPTTIEELEQVPAVKKAREGR